MVKDIYYFCFPVPSTLVLKLPTSLSLKKLLSLTPRWRVLLPLLPGFVTYEDSYISALLINHIKLQVPEVILHPQRYLQKIPFSDPLVSPLLSSCAWVNNIFCTLFCFYSEVFNLEPLGHFLQSFYVLLRKGIKIFYNWITNK